MTQQAIPDLRERFFGRSLRLLNPLARWMISAGIPTGAPNVLLIVRGRRSGIVRKTPLGMLDLDGRWFVQASYGQSGWAANLRSVGEAIVMHPGGRQTPVQAVELPPDEAAAILMRALEPYRPSRLLRALYGPHARGPVPVARRFGMRLDDTPEEFLAWARRHPLFELRPMSTGPAANQPPS
jgi:deazaflavin-dependent oxidoreductase (nitroreductase family)